MKDHVHSLISVLSLIEKPDGTSQVGSIVFARDQVLGYGAHGTIVYAGWMGQREIVVKRMLRQFHAHAQKEIELLINSDGHPKVIRYFAAEECGDFIYLALEKCEESLAHALGRKCPTKNRTKGQKRMTN